jgi:hypothetical protein
VRFPLPLLPFENALVDPAPRLAVAQFGMPGLEPGKFEGKNGVDYIRRFSQVAAYPITVHHSPFTYGNHFSASRLLRDFKPNNKPFSFGSIISPILR